jgi:hypothetical protein
MRSRTDRTRYTSTDVTQKLNKEAENEWRKEWLDYRTKKWTRNLIEDDPIDSCKRVYSELKNSMYTRWSSLRDPRRYREYREDTIRAYRSKAEDVYMIIINDLIDPQSSIKGEGRPT